ncbi:alpha/beta hydrolase fold domain-containing protein [Haliscomenobacter sp.]|uniref:alpha/beta hydrolase fold domain-containing protein n=1 Tax=Haliscomenobacter sp. TaxID=2717303 RepID=UPI003BAD2F41
MINRNWLWIALLLSSNLLFAQNQNPKAKLLPPGTKFHNNIPYQNDTLKKHLLDIYLPANATGKCPLLVFIHGGGWLVNDKYADMGYMGNTLSAILNQGIAIASIDYRWSTQAVFPAQIQDCNRAVSYLYDNAEKYGLDKTRIALMGFSAGGHLASLQGLSKNNDVAAFFVPGSSKKFSFKAVVDFYGPSELIALKNGEDPKSPEAILLGAAPLDRPDLAKIASPANYVDKNDPPFLIIHGEKDESVPYQQSKLLSSWLTVKGVKNELIIVKGAPHYGVMFDVEEVREKVLAFLKSHLL